MMNRFSGALVCLMLAATAASPGFAQDKKLTDVKFVLDFIPLGRHAPFYAGVAKGFYKDEGLNVTILGSKGTGDAIRSVESGVAEFGYIDVPSLIAGGNSTSVRVVAVNYQKAPYTVLSLKSGANITKPAGMVGMTLGTSSTSFVPRIHMAFMKMQGLDPKSIKLVNIDGSARVAMLMSKQVGAIDLFVMSAPGIERALKDKDDELRVLLLSDYGLELYSNSIGAKAEYIKNNPEIVKAFVRASLKAWKYTMDNPKEAAELQLQFVKGLNPEITVDELAIVKTLSVTPDTQANGYGWFSKEKMKKSVDFMVENIDIEGTKPTVDQVMVEGFLPTEPIRP